jgi:hypothetical protein
VTAVRGRSIADGCRPTWPRLVSSITNFVCYDKLGAAQNQEASTMSTTRGKPGKPGKRVQKNGKVSAAHVSDASDAGAVLTLSEAAA